MSETEELSECIRSDTQNPFVPWVVDLDGTLLLSDLLIDSFSALASEQPLRAITALTELRNGKAAFKARIAEAAQIEIDNALPWNGQLLARLRAERARGRRIYLASASDHSLVEAAAAHLGLFDGIFASDGKRNLSGALKAETLCDAFGESGFAYIGNAQVDFPIWAKARHVLVANAPSALRRAVRAQWPDAEILDGGSPGPLVYARALRVHQWVKNLLVLVPALAAHRLGGADLGLCLLSFASFSVCASAVYLLNDLLDLKRDRRHRTKRFRPLAAGTLPLLRGVALVPLLLLLSTGLALAVGGDFPAVVALYFVLTLSYSVVLKRILILDVVVLAALYGLRLYAGAVAVVVPFSAWLGAFSIFLFTALALVKRCAELRDRLDSGHGDPAGRAYRLGDLPILEALATAAGFTAVLVFGLYVSSDAVRALYTSPNRLWLICVVLIYWLARLIVLTHRSDMHEDPVVFAATDPASQICAVLCLGIVAASV
jgi:4-hydroxybenzoate polyprenyltransferase